MLISIFRFFDGHPAAYWSLAGLASCLFAGWTAWTFTQRGRNLPGTVHAVAAGATMLIVLLAWRWPPLFGVQELNPDESQLIAGALTLKEDPVFWRSVDGTTSGPLNFFALLPVHALGVPLDYFAARLSGLLMVWGTLLALYALLRLEFAAGAVLLGLSPGLAMFAAVTDGDFIHYSSEHLSILLIALSAWLLWRCRKRAASGQPFDRLSWIAAGALMGMLPWAKLQSAPLAATLALWGTSIAMSRTDLAWAARVREVMKLAVASLVPTLGFFASILAFDLWEHFYTCYIENNLIYASSDFTIKGSILKLVALSAATGSMHAFAVAPLAFGGLWLAAQTIRAQRPNPLLWPASALLAVSLVTVVAPRQGFHHYLLYVIPALALVSALIFGELRSLFPQRDRRLVLGLAFVLLGPGAILANRVRIPQIATLGELEQSWIEPFSEQGRLIRSYKRPGDRIAVWGWDCQVYVEARLAQGTREAHSTRQMWDSVQRDSYYRPRYMQDLAANLPAFFVDATGPKAFFFDYRDRWRHETFPELGRFVAEHYVLANDFRRSRVYVRKDRFAEHHPEVP
jgi:hypothetical protein